MTDTVTDLVDIKRNGNILQDARLPSRSYLVHTVDRFDSGGWFTCDQVIFLMCFACF